MRNVRKKRPPARSAPPDRLVEVVIDEVGARGDGIARLDGQPLFVPATLPGETVLVRTLGRRGEGLAAALVAVSAPSPARVTPPCRHFGTCGGCQLQHFAEEAYAPWKRGLLVQALSRAGLDPSVAGPLVRIPAGTRRRAAFSFAHGQGGLRLGFSSRLSHEVVDLAQCLLLDPALFALLAPLRALLAEVTATGASGDAVATVTETGLDLLVLAPNRLDLFARERLAAFADDHDLARLSWRAAGGTGIEPVAARRAPVVTFGTIPVEPPPGAFLQPSAGGERAIAGLVREALGAASPVLDLFAGCGSFTFPLAARTRVHAVEGDESLVAALTAAARRAGAPVSGEIRDLARRPYLAAELKPYQAVVFDPPRTGAAAQAAELARAGPSRVVAVSCNPATLARDARLLVECGYRLERVTPIDQFPWSGHLEAVAVFGR